MRHELDINNLETKTKQRNKTNVAKSCASAYRYFKFVFNQIISGMGPDSLFSERSLAIQGKQSMIEDRKEKKEK